MNVVGACLKPFFLGSAEVNQRFESGYFLANILACIAVVKEVVDCYKVPTRLFIAHVIISFVRHCDSCDNRRVAA